LTDPDDDLNTDNFNGILPLRDRG